MVIMMIMKSLQHDIVEGVLMNCLITCVDLHFCAFVLNQCEDTIYHFDLLPLSASTSTIEMIQKWPPKPE